MRPETFAALLAVVFGMMIAADASAEEIWHVKCIGRDGHTMAVKTIAAGGVVYDVKALPSKTANLLDLKALHPDGDQLDLKVVPSKESRDYSDVKAISGSNETLPVKAITSTGGILGVKAYYDSETDQYDINCLRRGGTQLGLVAISPEGRVFDVKGIKGPSGQGTLAIDAHLRAKPQQ